MSFIPYGRQDINESDIKSVVDVLNSDFLTQGPKVPQFEKAISTYSNVKYAFALNSATSALHVSCLALGVGESDYVWTSPISFVASSNCALYCGAQVDFVDIDKKSNNMCPTKLEEKLIQAKKENRLPKVVIPVHLSGQSCDMEKIYKLAKEYDFKVIEDASHAIGGKYKDEAIGNCRYSDICIFSFHPVKIITSAEGGMATTNSKELATKIELLRSHGITRNPDLMKNESHGPWYYEQVDLGFNYRMTELQAALGASQMDRLDEFIKARHKVVDIYNEKLKDLAITLPHYEDFNYSAWHLYIIRLKTGETKLNHLETFNKLREAQIGVNLHYMPIYLQPYYKDMGFEPGHCLEAETYYSQAISIPMYSSITEESVNRVCEVLGEIL